LELLRYGSLRVLTSCQDRLEEQYINPEKTTEASIGKFFTTMLDNRRVRADYWNIRTFLLVHPAVYTNTVSYTNVNNRYQQQLNYLDDFWKDYYTPNYYDQNRPTGGAGGVMAHMREIEKTICCSLRRRKATGRHFCACRKHCVLRSDRADG
jgi:hypothetical protein